MLLSIIVPVFNMAADNKLKHCLDSLINQTIDNYEIIAIDDCSTDNSFELMKEYEAKYPDKFKAIHSDVNRHQGGAKNIGIRAAVGEWIGFIDADDWIAPDMYEQLIRKAEETGADMVGCDYCLVDSYTFDPGDRIVANSMTDQTGELGLSQKRSMVLEGGSLVVKIYKRERIIKDELFFPENIFYEDNAMSASYLLGAKHYEYIQKPLYYYYQHDTSTVHTITEQRCNDRMEAGRILIKEAKRLGFYEELKAETEYFFTCTFYINTLFSYMPGVKHTRYSYVKKMGEEMRQYFPDFMKNPYYLEKTHPEEKKLIAMQQKSTLEFMIYYKLLWAYRNFRKKLGK